MRAYSYILPKTLTPVSLVVVEGVRGPEGGRDGEEVLHLVEGEPGEGGEVLAVKNLKAAMVGNAVYN